MSDHCDTADQSDADLQIFFGSTDSQWKFDGRNFARTDADPVP